MNRYNNKSDKILCDNFCIYIINFRKLSVKISFHNFLTNINLYLYI